MREAQLEVWIIRTSIVLTRSLDRGSYRDAQLGVRIIRTRSDGSEFGDGELMGDVQHRGIRTRSAGCRFGDGELLTVARGIRTRISGSRFGEVLS